MSTAAVTRARKPVAAEAGRATPSGADVVLGVLAAYEDRFYSLSTRYLGGKKFWHHRPTSRSDVHSAILSGVPYGSLIYFVNQVKGLDEGDVAKVLGISTRTLRRQSETPDKQMPTDLASKAWLFAETLAKATEIFGGKEEAERWMSKPAMGLDGQRPIDMLQTGQGAELVNDFLTRLEYGVYS
jgi:putative toxin-antitoxin system antitoxin component (TIGR02293 family)